jgi:hypothetical protein
VSRVWDVPARCKAVADLADELVELGVVKVTVESTSDYWRFWWVSEAAVVLGSRVPQHVVTRGCIGAGQGRVSG